jgi:hypothetical protein
VLGEDVIETVTGRGYRFVADLDDHVEAPQVALVDPHDESVYLPELLRMRGEQDTDPAAADRDYREAIELARSQGARSLEQRATGNLAALSARKTGQRAPAGSSRAPKRR